MIVALAAAVPAVLPDAIQAGHRDKDKCCKKCQKPCGRCCCPAQATPAPQTSYQPVIETQYAQQPVLQQRDVTVTEYRTEPVAETVPATTYENVTVDEGSYQTVWVPRLTTKAVARMTYQTRTSYRTVPYQVTKRISEYATQTVPYQTVRYVPTTGASLAYTTTPGYVATLPPTYTTGTPIVSGTYPAYAAAPVYPTYPTPVIASAPITSSIGPVPDPRFADAPSTPITPRMASRYDSYPSSSESSVVRGPSFVPAPSAAQVWRSSRGSMTR